MTYLRLLGGFSAERFTKVFATNERRMKSMELFLTHGGLFRRYGVLLDHILAIRRLREPPSRRGALTGPQVSGMVTAEDELFECLLWSTPMPGCGSQPNDSGRGVKFGLDKTAEFCWRNCVFMVLRSHGLREPQGISQLHRPQEVVKEEHGAEKTFVRTDDTSRSPLLLSLTTASDQCTGQKGAIVMVSCEYVDNVRREPYFTANPYEQFRFKFAVKQFYAHSMAAYSLYGTHNPKQHYYSHQGAHKEEKMYHTAKNFEFDSSDSE